VGASLGSRPWRASDGNPEAPFIVSSRPGGQMISRAAGGSDHARHRRDQQLDRSWARSSHRRHRLCPRRARGGTLYLATSGGARRLPTFHGEPLLRRVSAIGRRGPRVPGASCNPGIVLLLATPLCACPFRRLVRHPEGRALPAVTLMVFAVLLFSLLGPTSPIDGPARGFRGSSPEPIRPIPPLRLRDGCAAGR
jgi:hypothetical protein